MRMPILWVIFIYWYIMVVAMMPSGIKYERNIGEAEHERLSIAMKLE